MPDMRVGKTIIVSNEGELRERLGSETLVVTGSPRGGTSMVAYVIQASGYPLIGFTHGNHEDGELAAAWLDEKARKTVIDKHNAASRWGFKLPYAAQSIDWCITHIRRPIFVMIYRNPLSIARSIIAREPSLTGAPLGNIINHGLGFMMAGTKAVSKGAPTICVDVDEAKHHPAVFVDEMCETLDLSPADRAGIVREISTPGYTNRKEVPA
jgi:hypothetical protein